MTIDEAIKHCEEVAERYEKMEDSHDEKLKEECLQCAADHRQLAEWLKELKERRQSVKRGRWQLLNHEYGIKYYCCSVCSGGAELKRNYCPRCGADMRQEVKE